MKRVTVAVDSFKGSLSSREVAEAVEQGMVAWSRYESYLKILDEDDKYRK